MSDSYPRSFRVIAIGTLCFLYVPILVVVLYSFSDASLATVFGALSTKWYAALAGDQEILAAALKSFYVATMSATLGCILGTAIGFVLARHPRFPGATLYAGIITAPLVMPEVITGLSLLLTFVTARQLIAWDNTRSFVPLILSHCTFTTAYVAVIMRSNFANVDRSIEEAAMVLGDRPFGVFYRITLPLLIPAIITSWLLAFVISFDDLVISSFVAGPGTTTLPMVVFSRMRVGVTPEINALASVMVYALAIIVMTISVVQVRRLKIRSLSVTIEQTSQKTG
jgi:putrescine transport system permease protein